MEIKVAYLACFEYKKIQHVLKTHAIDWKLLFFG